jgi:hypothetical protein
MNTDKRWESNHFLSVFICVHLWFKILLCNLLAGLSLIMLLALAGDWVRSLRTVDEVEDAVSWNSSAKMNGTAIGLGSWNGHIEFILRYSRHGTIPVQPQGYRWTHYPSARYAAPQDNPTWSFCGIYAAESLSFFNVALIDINKPDAVTKYFGVPDWLIAGFLMLPPFLWLHGFLKRRRQHRLGHCAKCGYDLRATPDRCPECGATRKMVATRILSSLTVPLVQLDSEGVPKKAP